MTKLSWLRDSSKKSSNPSYQSLLMSDQIIPKKTKNETSIRKINWRKHTHTSHKGSVLDSFFFLYYAHSYSDLTQSNLMALNTICGQTSKFISLNWTCIYIVNTISKPLSETPFVYVLDCSASPIEYRNISKMCIIFTLST